MRKDKLSEALNSIKTHSPRWFWTRCQECGEDFKEEEMWWFRNHDMHGSWKHWACKHCCSTPAEVMRKNPQYFSRVAMAALDTAQEELSYVVDTEE